MSSTVNPLVLYSLCLIVGSVWSQSSTHDAFIIQYLERRLLQMEERLSQCELNTQSITQKNYDLSSEIRVSLSTLSLLRSEVKSQVDDLSMRMDRVERELEYLENKIPTPPNIEMEEALLEQQIKDAKLEQLKKKAGIKVENDCRTTLSQIKSLKIVKKAGDVYGSWLKDTSKGSNKVYLFSGIRNKTVLEFPSLQSFKKKAKPQTKQLQLPFHWQGTGHVVLDGFLYYHKADTPNQILKFDLLNSTVVDRTFIPGAGKLPTYSLNLNTYMDLAVDELGLWVIYADPDYGGNLVITKLDKGTLAVEYTWDTQCKSRDAEGAFLMCGTLYVVYNTGYGGRSTIQCLYDIHDTIHSNESPVMFFPKRYSSHSSIHYHPGDKQLYAWDDGYQTIYEVETRRSY
ncbi:Olfactomedin-like protein 1 [Oryzias melastigma]|uniref:Olfactomedin-like protein 1 n=1 Tax=Oryzias melastigma TaxID=30732 RepID=A0A3B3DNZ1_ORYME|nr:olfactomedin-like protein 1 [Oryzias melastigma]KAF6737026.1 Olfactomedin-like protein 1 [Oryzias melastigma]